MDNLPNMSSETGILRISPVNSHVVCLASIPEVPSNTLKEYKTIMSVIIVAYTLRISRQHGSKSFKISNFNETNMI